MHPPVQVPLPSPLRYVRDLSGPRKYPPLLWLGNKKPRYGCRGLWSVFSCSRLTGLRCLKACEFGHESDCANCVGALFVVHGFVEHLLKGFYGLGEELLAFNGAYIAYLLPTGLLPFENQLFFRASPYCSAHLRRIS